MSHNMGKPLLQTMPTIVIENQSNGDFRMSTKLVILEESIKAIEAQCREARKSLEVFEAKQDQAEHSSAEGSSTVEDEKKQREKIEEWFSKEEVIALTKNATIHQRFLLFLKEISGQDQQLNRTVLVQIEKTLENQKNNGHIRLPARVESDICRAPTQKSKERERQM